MSRKLLARLATVTAASAFLVAGTLTSPAQAVAGWTTIVDEGSHASVLICKRAVSGAYGPLWEINVATLSSRNYRVGVTVRVKRNGAEVGQVRVEASNGQWSTGRIYASRSLPDRVEASGGIGTISPYSAYGGTTAPLNPATDLATCG